ncbi:helix-turn-helix domain-containing protein [Polyangium mundeleinium]|uniref:Helix-turn-helix domain-containing protein n=1 Tax=Polyangium mundeleinium TaxID=2995306 RepID=A0ABT5F6Y2_9BACT|nr:helix-turn-helix domain-containing protein [Polyangium mundeleinium]MDC0749227.1 helix-turn-helix domain-containing protein [Polyangium mundeleinium]
MSTATQDQLSHETQPSSQTRAVRPALAFMGSRVVGQSATIEEVVRVIGRLSMSRVPVHFVGEPGAGKRFFARVLHETTAQGPLVVLSDESAPIDTAALHAAAESARGGTLVVVAIDRLPAELSAELVALANRGDTRLVVTSERPLDPSSGCNAALCALFAETTVKLPTLQERANDLPQLVQHFFELHAARAHRNDLRGISPEASSLLEGHTFAEHARGLERAIEQAVGFAEGPYVTVSDLPEEIRAPKAPASPLLLGALPVQGLDLRAAVEEFETRMILQALERTGWNKNRASRLLGLNRTTLVEMIKRKRLAPPPGARKPVSAKADAHEALALADAE